MNRIYRYNPSASYKANGERYLQIMSATDLYIQNIAVSEHGNHRDSFQVKFPNVFTNYPFGQTKIEDQRFVDCDHYRFTLWQTQLNLVVFSTSSACGISLEHMNAKTPMIRSIYIYIYIYIYMYRVQVYYHIRRILKILEILLPYENMFNQYNNPSNNAKFIGICSEYRVYSDLTKWRIMNTIIDITK